MFKTDIGQMKSFLQQQRRPGEKMNLTFEISGQADYMYDSLLNSVDSITVSKLPGNQVLSDSSPPRTSSFGVALGFCLQVRL